MRRSRWLLVLMVAVLPFSGCTKGDECDTCSEDTDCKSGLVCSRFNDESKRCGTGTGATTCRVR